MMVVALTAIFSFALGVLLSAMATHLFLSHVRGKRAGAVFMGGVLRGMAAQGRPRLTVWTPEYGMLSIATVDLASAVESDMLPAIDEAA